MEQLVLLAVQAIEGLLPSLALATSGQLQGVILLLEKVVPIAVGLGMDAIGPIQNIIAALQGSGAVSAEQVAALRVQSAALDAALDDAAKADGLEGA